MKKIILVTIGDINGIGIEILLKIWKTNKNNKFILISNNKILKNYLKKNNILIKIKIINNEINNLINIDFNNILNIYNYDSYTNEENSYKSLSNSYRLLKKFSCFSGVVNLPINKDKIIKNIDKKFIGQTEFYMKKSNTKIANMVFVYKELIFSTLTTHVSLKKINQYLSNKALIYEKIISLNETLINDFNKINPKIIISGINPHAGENDTIGNEESIYLKPVIKKLNKSKIHIKGPYSADGMINNRNLNEYDCFIFNYHDQALIPFKILSKNNGVNFTSGLDIIRISPDHGTAYDIVGKNIASINGLINCFKFIHKIDKNRNQIVKT